MQTRHNMLLKEIDELLVGSCEEISALIDVAQEELALDWQSALAEHARQRMAMQALSSDAVVAQVAGIFMHLRRAAYQVERIDFLLDASAYFLSIGKYARTRALTVFCLDRANALNQRSLIRRAHSSVGALQILAADYHGAATHLGQAFALALGLSDRIAAASALVNVAGLFSQMGLYGEALSAARAALSFTDDSPKGRAKRIEAAGNGLFCAHRSKNHAAALEFLQIGSASTTAHALSPSARAVFEYARAIYLVDANDAETAAVLIQAARADLMPTKNPGVEIALDLAACLCQWASRESGSMRQSRARLRELYQLSKQTNVLHDDVLLALMRVYGTAVTPEEAKIGMEYARELVEYTTRVKKTEFFHQLSLRCVEVAGPAAGATKSFENTEIRSTAYDAAENWAVAAEFFDDNTGEHCFRVGHLAGLLAREIGMDDEFCVRIEHAARLHDIGKVAVNEMILLKPGPLNPVELTAMREHTNVGAELLDGTQDETLKMAREIAHYHHEWWNGAGYPAALSMMEIPMSARICALADVYDALTHRRAYKHAWTHEAAVTEIENLQGLQFDPSLVPAFLRVLERARVDGAWVKAAGHGDAQANSVIQARRMLVDAIEAAGA